MRPYFYRLQCLVGAAFLLMAPSHLFAAVTYGGSEGVQAQVFSQCAGCHDGDAQNGGRRFDSHAFATQHLSAGGAVTVAGYSDARANARVSAGQMPTSGALSESLQNFLNAWASQRVGATPPPNTLAPELNTTAATSEGRYSARLNGTAIENGTNVSFSFRYSQDSATVNANGGSLVAVDTDNTTTSGGANVSYSVARTINNLTCGTRYYFRLHGGGVNGGTQFFDTDVCPTINTITNKATDENTAVSPFSVTSANASGLTSITYELNQVSIDRGMTLVGGTFNWSAANIPDTPTSDTTYTVTVTATYSETGQGSSQDTDQFDIVVTAVNDLPTITSIAPTTATEDTPYVYNVTTSDVEAGAVTVALDPGFFPAGMQFNGPALPNRLTWTPTEGVTSSGTVRVRATDAQGGQSTQSFTITVSGTNDPPVITAKPSAAATEDVQYIFNVVATDPENGVLSYSLTGAPAGAGGIGANAMVINPSTGQITWTPGEGQTSSGTVTLIVSDGSLNDTETFSISVNAVNDAPVVDAIPPQTATTNNFSRQADADDPDNTDAQMTWSLTNAPPGMAISVGTNGLITWNDFGTAIPGIYLVTVIASDGVLSGNTVMSFTIPDVDNDGVPNYRDNCPATSNPTQANNDGDAQGDACDADDDNDIITDAAEVANDLDPMDAGDAAGDKDGDGLSNATEFATCAGNGDTTVCTAISVDSVAPVIVTGDAVVNIVATGYFTPMPASIVASANDGIDGAVAVSANTNGPFRSGEHVITWSASDGVGNTRTATQTLRILPLASLGGTQTAGEGQKVTVTARLSGPAPSYPVRLHYTLTGTADSSDHTLSDGWLTFDAGATESDLVFELANDGMNEIDETLVLTLDAVSGDAVLVQVQSHTVLIASSPQMPTVNLSISQDGALRHIVYRDGGSARVRVSAQDANDDALIYQWDTGALVGSVSADQQVFTISAVSMPAGRYPVLVTVTDGLHVVQRDITIIVEDATPTLQAIDSDGDGVTDIIEGVTDTDDDGLLDYRDAVTMAEGMLLRTGSGASLLRTITTEPGLRIMAGSYAVQAQSGGAQVLALQVVNESDVVLVDPTHMPIGAIYDFEIHGLTSLERTARVVLPLPVTLPRGAVWRKLGSDDRWHDVVVDGTDAVHSANGVNGQCPAVADGAWETGLLAGRDCVRLTLTDGGPNDADGEVNGIIRDPSAPAVPYGATSASEPG
jgi:predicted lipoprotein with Yx(FWY)xxD motif